VTGGFITYNIVEKKKIREKRLEALFELLSLVQKIENKVNSLSQELKPYIEKEIDKQFLESIEKYRDFLLYDITDMGVEIPKLAIHINGKTFNNVTQILRENIKSTDNLEFNLKFKGDSKEYIKHRVGNLHKIENNVIKMKNYLQSEADSYIREYAVKYTNK
jgi:hypothetical protein